MTEPRTLVAHSIAVARPKTREQKRRARQRRAAHVERRRRKEDFPPKVRRDGASEYFWEVWGVEISPNTLAKKSSGRDRAAIQEIGEMAVL